MAVFGIMHAAFWVLTNHTDKSIGWVEKAFATDPANYYRHSFSNESMLGAIFSSNDLKEKSLQWERKAYLKHPNDARTGYNYANILIRENKTDEAIPIMERLLVKFPYYPLPYASLIGLYYENKDYERLYAVLSKMESVYQQNPAVFTSRIPQEQLDSYWNLLKQFRQ